MATGNVRVIGVAFLLAVSGLAVGQNAPATPAAAPAAAKTVVLKMARRNGGGPATIWRYWETVGTDVARTPDGKTVPVDPFNPRSGYDRRKALSGKEEAPKDQAYPLQAAPSEQLSPAPPPEWTGAAYDDVEWARTLTPFGQPYRAIARAFLRARFLVPDAAQAAAVTLEASVQGGAVFYLNGQEVGRVGLPAGPIDATTLAEDYPTETYFVAGGSPLPHGFYGSAGQSALMAGEADFASGRNSLHKDPKVQAAYKKRFRHVTIDVPPGALKAGVNVLAVQVLRSAAPEAMFTTVLPKTMGSALMDQRFWWWNRCSLEDLELAVTAPPGAVEPNVGPPPRAQLWNVPISMRVDGRFYGEPGAACGPVRIDAVRNGVFSDQVVLTAPTPLRNLAAKLQPAGNKPLPAAWATLGYLSLHPGMGYDPVEEAPPAEVPAAPKGGVAMQPMVVTVRVPADAAPGDYTATLSVSAEGIEAIQTPVQVHVGDWTVPAPRDSVMHNAFIQSPDSLAITYNVPMWSAAHWALIERSFAVLADLACKEITVPLVRRAHFGNEHAMVWFVRNDDGTVTPRLDIAEKYIHLAVKHLGKVPVVCLYVIEADVDRRPWVTYFDPRTGELQDERAPAWGTPESLEFWKPAMDGLRDVLARQGLAESYCLGYHAANGNGPVAPKGCIDDMKELAPQARWVRLGHYWFRGHDHLDKGPNGNPWARVAQVSGDYVIAWEPGVDKPFYGWRNPHAVLAYTRGIFHAGNPVCDYRLAPETVVLSGWREETGASAGRFDIAGGFGRDAFPGLRGFGPWGADFWAPIIARYNDPAAAQWDPRCSWSTTQINNGIIPYVIGKGTTGPVPSVRTLAFREGIQDVEARRMIQDAVDDEASRAKLGPALAEQARTLCDNRTRLLRFWSQCGGFDPPTLDRASGRLYRMAEQVAKALAK